MDAHRVFPEGYHTVVGNSLPSVTMGPVVPMAVASVDSTASCRSVLLCMFVCVTEELGRDAETPEQEENGNYFSKKYNPPISS